MITCQERRFGQIDANAAYLKYEIQMDRAEFVNRCGPLYLEYVGYEKDDEKFRRFGTNAMTDRWQQLRYPALDELIDQDPALLQHLLQRRFGSAFLRMLFPLGDETRFILSSFSSINIASDGIVFAGLAWEVTPR